MGVAKLWKGALTVEDAAAHIGIEPVTLVGFAALGGIPKGYGPFPSVEGSTWRIFIDEADLDLWNAAGRPADKGYRRRAKRDSPPRGEML